MSKLSLCLTAFSTHIRKKGPLQNTLSSCKLVRKNYLKNKTFFFPFAPEEQYSVIIMISHKNIECWGQIVRECKTSKDFLKRHFLN